MVTGLRALAAGVLALLVATCGGGSSSSSQAAKFCADFNLANCKREFDCTPQAERANPDFVAFNGKSPEECAQRWTQLCVQRPSGVEITGSCPEGSAVNTSKATACLAQVASASCMDIDQAILPACESVCGAPADAGSSSAGPVDAGSISDGKGSSSTPPPAATLAEKQKFCQDAADAICNKLSSCVSAALFVQAFPGGLAECILSTDSGCLQSAASCVFDSHQAQLCLTETPALQCQALIAGNTPASCDLACP